MTTDARFCQFLYFLSKFTSPFDPRGGAQLADEKRSSLLFGIGNFSGWNWVRPVRVTCPSKCKHICLCYESVVDGCLIAGRCTAEHVKTQSGVGSMGQWGRQMRYRQQRPCTRCCREATTSTTSQSPYVTWQYHLQCSQCVWWLILGGVSVQWKYYCCCFWKCCICQYRNMHRRYFHYVNLT